MNSLVRWIGPGAVIGGLGAALWCGAGVAAADAGSEAGSTRAAHASAAGTDAPVRQARTSPAPRNRTVPAAAVNRAVPAPAASRVVSIKAKNSPAPAAAVAAAKASVAPSSVPVDPARYAGTWYEQGSVKQFFSIGLVNTKAVYTVKPDGNIRVQNSGNYFFNRGPKSAIVGAAVPVNDINTALNVGFGFPPGANAPGNYWIIDRADDYSWAIVSDPSGRSGYILTRDKTIDQQEYHRLVARAHELGVTGNIRVTRQFPA